MQFSTSLLVALSLPLVSSAAIIDNFEDDTPGSAPAGWYDANGWDVAVDPNDSGNQLLSVRGRGGNFISGTNNNATLGAAETGALTFSIFFRSSTNDDVNVGMTTLSDLSSTSSATFFGPMLRLVDGGISLYDGAGDGSGSFLAADQSVSLDTWYTISMVIDNDANSWSGTIVGGAFGSPTTLSNSSTTDFGFRTDDSNDLVNFAVRANSQHGSSNGLLLDDITLNVIPEPQTYALAALTGVAVLFIRRRR